MFVRKRSRIDTLELSAVVALADSFAEKTDQQLREQVDEWRESLRFSRVTLDEIQVEAVALAREVAKRATGLNAYEVQVQGALALLGGTIAELATGEGKTLVAAIAALVYALEGRGVHVATVNSYLAERDCEFARPIFESIGLSIGLLPERGENPAKRAAYAKDVTYGVGYEFGFDYLRDQLALMRQPQLGATQRLFQQMLDDEPAAADVVQRGLAAAIIDEVDSVLIDEAGSPLVISEPSPQSNEEASPYHFAHQQASELVEGEDFTIQKRRPRLTPGGLQRIHENEDIPWPQLRRPWQNYVSNALMATHVFNRDEHYIVRDDEVVIVDVFTGRAHEERSWNGGLHQAVNAKEDTKIQPELESAASITRQRYYGLYDRICGLTGTASESAAEFKEFFGLLVTRIPEHRSNQREVLPDRMFPTSAAAIQAVVDEVRSRHERGQPILVGTRTIRISDQISEQLKERNIPHRLLSAKEDKEENEIVAEAGQRGKVLIATNMAGRGTHIGLTDEVIELGGLHVIGVERNESSRVDRQLIGRCARQGEPGGAQFFVSADDAITAKDAKSLLAMQAKLEQQAYQQRRLANERDQWTDQTRQALA